MILSTGSPSNSFIHGATWFCQNPSFCFQPSVSITIPYLGELHDLASLESRPAVVFQGRLWFVPFLRISRRRSKAAESWADSAGVSCEDFTRPDLSLLPLRLFAIIVHQKKSEQRRQWTRHFGRPRPMGTLRTNAFLTKITLEQCEQNGQTVVEGKLVDLPVDANQLHSRRTYRLCGSDKKCAAIGSVFILRAFPAPFSSTARTNDLTTVQFAVATKANRSRPFSKAGLTIR
jgi:hypothetical protein